MADQDPALVTRMLSEHVSDSSVEVILRFDDTRVGPAVVLGLGEGDVIPLDHPVHHPMSLTVSGAPVARATAGTSGGRLACVVTDS